MKKLLRFGLFSLLALTAQTVTGQVYAAQVNTTDSIDTSNATCLNPIGPVLADYPNGEHGIIGDTGYNTGHDTVYSLGAGNAIQCFCVDGGQGVETNWKKASNLSSDEIKILESQGWIYVPDGASWGLDEGPYLAKNTSFTCHTSGGGSSSNNSSSSNNDSKVLGASAVLGLANTGNIIFIYSVFAFWAVTSILALLLKKKGK